MTRYHLLFFVTVFLCGVNILPLSAQSKHGLIIAIGDYKYWRPISSKNDVPYIKNTLLKQGFQPGNIITLIDAKATRTGIENAFKTLIGKVKNNDVVFIHFSSHGEQVEDNNQDEMDGLDETIVTWDAAKLSGSQNYQKEQVKYFRDDQFGQYINELRAKLGKEGDIIVFMDACHSGSGTRGNRRVRGDERPLVSKSFKKPVAPAAKTANVFLEKKEARISSPNGLATYVIVSAALAEEKNFEATYDDGKEGGSLSIAIAKVFENLKPGTTYRSLFASILSILNDIVPDQHPVIEGDGIDRVLFGGKFVEQKPYVEIESIKDNKLVLKAGLLQGLDSGAKVNLYPAGINDPAGIQPVATGTIVAAESFRSSVLLDKKPPFIQPAEGWVFLTEPVYKVNPVTIGFGSGGGENTFRNFSPDEEKFYKTSLQDIPLVSFTGVPELLLAKGTERDSIKIAGNGYVYNTIRKNNADSLRKQMQRYMQYKFLQRIELNDPKCRMDVKLVPWKNGNPDTVAALNMMTNGILECRVKDTLVVWVKNTGNIPLYLNILDIQPDGKINPILPYTRAKRGDADPKIIKPEELKIEPGVERFFSRVKIVIGPPLGLEIFKIFISATQIDMEKIADRDLSNRGNFSILETLVDQSYQLNTRGDVIAGQASGSTWNLPFRINPAIQ